MEILNEMPRLNTISSDLSKYLWTKRLFKKTSANSQICPGKGKGCNLTPKTKQHTEHDSVTLAKDATTWRKSRGHFRQESTSVKGRAGRSWDSGQVAIWKVS